MHIKHAGTEEYYNLEEIVDNRITVNIVDESPVQGRLHYSTFDTWSPWGSSDSPVNNFAANIFDVELHK